MSFAVTSLIIVVKSDMNLINTNGTTIPLPTGKYEATHCHGTTKSYDLRDFNTGKYMAKVEINIDGSVAYIS